MQRRKIKKKSSCGAAFFFGRKQTFQQKFFCFSKIISTMLNNIPERTSDTTKVDNSTTTKYQIPIVAIVFLPFFLFHLLVQ